MNISPLSNCFMNVIMDSSMNIAIWIKFVNDQGKEVAIISIMISAALSCLYIMLKAFGANLHDQEVASSLVWLPSIPQMPPPMPSNCRHLVGPGLQQWICLFVWIPFQKGLWQICHLCGSSSMHMIGLPQAIGNSGTAHSANITKAHDSVLASQVLLYAKG